MRIVLVDDDEDIRFLVRTVLADADHEVVGEASDIAHAVTEVARAQPEVIVTDLVMGAKEGAEPLLSRLHEAAPGARIVIFSGWDHPLPAGADAYVVKGGVLDELVDAIDGIGGAEPPTPSAER